MLQVAWYIEISNILISYLTFFNFIVFDNDFHAKFPIFSQDKRYITRLCLSNPLIWHITYTSQNFFILTEKQFLLNNMYTFLQKCHFILYSSYVILYYILYYYFMFIILFYYYFIFIVFHKYNYLQNKSEKWRKSVNIMRLLKPEKANEDINL